ncbi:MAG TPA: DnaJ domain-containing protein [Polyangiaceae bacterium]|nr:DnaJ domain-containing protein [Polyangiaceae bacterium]
MDGAASEFEIAESAGLEIEAVAATLEELARLGAVRFGERAANEVNRTPRPAARPSGSFRVGPIVESASASEPHHPAAALYDPKELEEAVDLDVAKKRTILETFHHLDTISHYQLLQVQPSADKRAIKAAYYEVVNVFHPDRYFGKNLGSFKPKLERVFARLTEAYDVLTRAGPRAEYDAYLALRNQTRELDHKTSDSAVEAQVQAIQRQIEEEARAAERALAQTVSTPPVQSISPPRSITPTPSIAAGAAQRIPSQRPLDADARKRALARKLAGGTRTFSGSIPAQASPSLTPASGRSELQGRAAEDLKRRYEQRIVQAREQQAERYVADARRAITSKDAVSAANALRIAATLVPDNPGLSARIQEAQLEADALLSGHYLAQAQYEEREGRMAEAARSYARATAGNPNSKVFERAAYCGLMAAIDLRLAGEHARRAVALASAGQNEEGQARVTLARIYVTAGMKQSALAEFERAATLAPNDDTIKDWIRRLKRGEA